LTRLSEGRGHASAYEALKAQFTEEEQVKLTLMINIINGWNRIAVDLVCGSIRQRSSPPPRRSQPMTHATPEDAAPDFGLLRPKLRRVAYRMLGSVADAEDVVHEAFIRWMKADRSDVREPEAFLRRTVTRLCLDQLKSARHQRETYVGNLASDPTPGGRGTGGRRHLAADACTRTPFSAGAGCISASRCFGLEFEEVATTIQRDPAACRQLAPRARTHVRERNLVSR